jgi:hypothetical protein
MAVTTFNSVIPVTRFPGGIAQSIQTYKGTADALKIYSGTALFIGTTIDAATLALPVAGNTDQNLNGQDNIGILIIDTTGHAHTVTTPTNGVVPSHHLITFNGTVGSWVKLIAYNAKWYPVGSSGVTIG